MFNGEQVEIVFALYVKMSGGKTGKENGRNLIMLGETTSEYTRG